MGDLLLKWDKAREDKGKHIKFQSLWIEPFTIHENLGQHMYHIHSLDERIDSLLVNDQDKELFSMMIWGCSLHYVGSFSLFV